MKNPWTKKNPLLSMWLSGANAVIGSARGRATTEAKRQARAATSRGVRQLTDVLTGAATRKMTKKKRR